ncbi:MAG: prolyl oligopeptidase family serine peptidase [Candidatus Obscuribacterales bacterium]|nr:prolyl oligopeptidase family serine peptidase [Candidatus Obscuribacterales bacterium]
METTPVKSRIDQRPAPKMVREHKLSPPPNTMTMVTVISLMILSGLTYPYWHLLSDRITAGRAPEISQLPTDTKTVPSWQNEVRSKLTKALHVEKRNSPLQSRVIEDKVVRTLMYDGNFLQCRRQTLEFSSAAGTPAFAYLLLPEKISPGQKLPCVICLPGHGAGVDHSVGIDSDGTLMQMWDKTPRDFALFFAYRGYAVLAMEQVGIGRRSLMPIKGPVAEKAECLLSDAQLRYQCKTSLGERVTDVFNAVDLLTKEPFIDPKRLAVMGISAGGTTALYSAALD